MKRYKNNENQSSSKSENMMRERLRRHFVLRRGWERRE